MGLVDPGISQIRSGSEFWDLRLDLKQVFSWGPGPTKNLEHSNIGLC